MTVWIALAGGTVARIPALLIQARRSNNKIWKIFPLTIAMTVFELAGTMILYILENGKFGGMSYYGGILLMPIFCFILVPFFRIPYRDVTDMFGAAAGGMLAVMRLECACSGCCAGRVVQMPWGGKFAFPSPIVELIIVLILMVIVLIYGKNPRTRGKLYSAYLILYGSTRFVLNGFRAGLTPFVWKLPAGHFWSLVAIVIGIVWLLIDRAVQKNKSVSME